jgi:hypothetical protein
VSHPDDPYADLIAANRDEILRVHQEAVSCCRRCLRRGDVELALQILHALNLFHPMHGESWRGFPEGRRPDEPTIIEEMREALIPFAVEAPGAGENEVVQVSCGNWHLKAVRDVLAKLKGVIP